MELWLAAVLLIVCATGAVIAGMRYRKSRKAKFAVLAVVASLLAAAALVYTGLTLILINGVGDASVEKATEAIAQAYWCHRL